MFYLVMIPKARWLSRQWMLHSTNMFCLLPKPKFFIVAEEEKKNCFKITKNLLYCSLRYIYKHIGTPKFLVKVLLFFLVLYFQAFYCQAKQELTGNFFNTPRPNKSTEAILLEIDMSHFRYVPLTTVCLTHISYFFTPNIRFFSTHFLFFIPTFFSTVMMIFFYPHFLSNVWMSFFTSTFFLYPSFFQHHFIFLFFIDISRLQLCTCHHTLFLQILGIAALIFFHHIF